MPRVYILVLLLICSLGIKAAPTDSLQQELDRAETDSVRLQILFRLARESQNIPVKALDYAGKALQFAQKSGGSKWLGAAYSLRGQTHYLLGDYTKALQDYQRAYDMADSTNNQEAQVSLLGQIGKVHEQQGDLDAAEARYQKALEIADQLGEYAHVRAFALSNMANLLYYRQRYDSALSYHQEAVRVREQNNDSVNVAFSYNDMAVVYMQSNDLEAAKASYAKALALFERYDLKKYAGTTLINIGSLYMNTEQYQQAEQYFTEGMEIAKALEDKGLLLYANMVLYQMYKARGDIEQALLHLEQYNTYRDSVMSEQHVQETARLQNAFDFKEEQKNRILAEEKQKVQKAQLEQQQAQLIGAVTGVLLLSILALTFWQGRRKQQTANNLLRDKNEEISQIAANLQEANTEISEQHKSIRASIQYAQRIQTAILPDQHTRDQLLGEHFIFFKPRDVVSGDFYFCAEQDDKLIFAAVDCTGHGVPGAFMSLIGNELLTAIIAKRQITDPAQILTQLDQEVQKTLRQESGGGVRDGMDMALCTYDPQHKKLAFAGAKNPMAYVDEAGKIQLLSANRRSIGGSGKRQKQGFETRYLTLETPTWVYLFSDGYPDQFGGDKNRKFTRKQLLQVLEGNHTQDPATQEQVLGSTLEKWQAAGNEKQIDDVLVMGVRLG